MLIAGAGPTGMVLALWLTKKGVPVRIIDKTDKPGTTSRATVVQARTIEFYRQMGIDQVTIGRGIPFKAANIWVKGKHAARLPFGESGKSITAFPYILIFTQDRHEAMLVEQLAALGVNVERSTELVSFEDKGTGIRALLRKANGDEEYYDAAYLAGCDGAHSVVRSQLGTGMPGGTYSEVFYVADLKVSGEIANGEMNAALDDADFLIIFPMPGEGRVRLVGAIRPEAQSRKDLAWNDVEQSIMTRLPMKIEEVSWFSTYHVHHRVAAHFRKGNIFLLGDAGHIHSPVGGQGMNTGIGDAVNLAWKMAAVLQGEANISLLDTYEPERIAFARKLVATTDRAFTFVNKRSALAQFMRIRIMPKLLRLLFQFTAIRRGAFRILSQTEIEYRDSALSSGKAGKLHGGDRLPWIKIDNNGTDNYAPLSSMEWQVHCYGEASAALQSLCAERHLPVHVFPWNKNFGKAGFAKNAAYLLRPDGYIGLVTSEPEQLAAYLDQRGIVL